MATLRKLSKFDPLCLVPPTCAGYAGFLKSLCGSFELHPDFFLGVGVIAILFALGETIDCLSDRRISELPRT